MFYVVIDRAAAEVMSRRVRSPVVVVEDNSNGKPPPLAV